jgi:hypothetical protein
VVYVQVALPLALRWHTRTHTHTQTNTHTHTHTHTPQAQQNYVIEVPLANGSSAWVWTGDKWQQSPDGMYDEQPQTWLPLEWAGDELLPFHYVDVFTLDVAS